MAHYVTCVYCSKKYDRDKLPTVQISARRYAHSECYKEHEENKSQEEKDIEALEKYIMKLFQEDYVNPRIRKQIKEYQQQYHYTYSGMLKTLVYWYEIKGNSTEKANGGIGIIPYIYKDASNYYYSLYLAKLANENKDFAEYRPKERFIEIESPRTFIKPPRFFNLDDSEGEE